MPRRSRFLMAFVALFMATVATAQEPILTADFGGTWELDAKASDEVPAWRQMRLLITVEGETVTIVRNLGWGRRQHADTINIPRSSGSVVTPFAWWADNKHLAAYVGGDQQRTISVDILDGGRTLRTESSFQIETQQSDAFMRVTSEYKLWPDGKRLTLIETRTSRMTPIVHHFNRAEKSSPTP